MADLPSQLKPENSVSCNEHDKLNSIIWADDILILSDSVEGLNLKLETLNLYCHENVLKINTEKTKCMTFNKTGRIIRRNFFLGDTKLENVRSYKYLGLVFTPSGELKTALDDLRSRALKAYMCLKHKMGILFYTYVEETIKLFDTIIKPILTYSSDFWECLKLPKRNPIENLHIMFCKNLLGVQRNTTNIGVLLELGRTPLTIIAQKQAIKNWDRIRNSKANQLIKSSYKAAEAVSLNWFTSIKMCLAENGFLHLSNETAPIYTRNIDVKVYNRLIDIFHQNSFESINNEDSKLRTYSIIKKRVGIEPYLKEICNPQLRFELSKFRLSNHKLMIEVGRHNNIPRTKRFCPFCQETVEDEIHFLTTCKQYTPLRSTILRKCRDIKPNFPYYTNQQKFIFIMTCPLLTYDLAKFVSNATKLRELQK